MQLMGGSSLLAKAQTALQAAAAKADRAITEFKADLKADFKGADASKGSDGKREQQLLLHQQTAPAAFFNLLEAEKIVTSNSDSRKGSQKNEDDDAGGKGSDSEKKSNETGFRQRILPRKPSSSIDGDFEGEKNSSTEGGFRQRILRRKSADKDFQSAMAVIGGDEELKAQDFWKRYFSSSTLKNLKQDLLDRDSEVRVSGDSVVSSVDLSSSCADSPKKDPIEEEDYKRAFSVVSIPPSSLLRRLAAVAENGKSAKMQKNASQRRSLDKESPSTSGEWTGLVTGLAMVRKLSQKDGKFRSSSNNNRGRHHALMGALFEVDTDLNVMEVVAEESSLSPPKKMRLPQEILGAPPDSFVAKLAELMGGMKSEQRMAEFWTEVISELRRRWFAGEPIPRMPVDASPDLHYCSLHQQLQLINCCIARRKRRASILASLPEAQFRGFEQLDDSQMSLEISGSPPLAGDLSLTQYQSTELYAKLKDGRLVLRLGADHPADDLKMLETGEPVYSPLTQESPLFTEDSIREAEELVLRTGSVGAGCSHLLSDMQAFKAANPGCILEDFVRWYSPPDWREDPDSGLNQVTISEDSNEGTETETTGTEARGYLSARMQSKGNLWQELWASARPIPAVRQSPLFDEELAGESTLDALENLPPCEVYKQLFTAAFSVGYALAEGSEAAKQDPLMTCLREFSDFITYSCGRDMNGATLDSMCEAYEALEAAILVPPEEVPETQGRQWLSSLKAFRVAEKN